MSVVPTVFVVDDDRAVREALELLLESSGLRAKCYDTGQKFLDAYRPDWPGCLILDVRMPGMSGLELQQALAARGLRIPIIFLTGHGDVPLSVKAMQSGAIDFIEKPFVDEALLARVREALRLDTRRRSTEARKDAIKARFARLTPREQQVMALVVAGKSNKEIAAHLRVSHRTVEIHRTRVIEKMGARFLPDLVAMAAVCGIHEPLW